MTGDKCRDDRFRERYKKQSLKRWFWKGLWIIPFMIAVDIGVYIIVVAFWGASSMMAIRGRLMVAITVVAGVVLFVISLIGSGWAQEQADKRVKG